MVLRRAGPASHAAPGRKTLRRTWAAARVPEPGRAVAPALRRGRQAARIAPRPGRERARGGSGEIPQRSGRRF